jgi:hypothetical protein
MLTLLPFFLELLPPALFLGIRKNDFIGPESGIFFPRIDPYKVKWIPIGPDN